MKLFLCFLLVSLAVGDRLENTYIPPTSAKTAGGSGSFLSTPTFVVSSPFRSVGESGPANSYVPPAAGPVSANSYEPSSDYSSGKQGSYSAGPQIRILKLDSQNPGDGSYNFEYETENKISQHEAGEVRHGYGDESTNVVRGSYSYTAPDGQQITVNYVADENGFRPEGAHIPTPPPVPEDIKKSLSASHENGGYQYQGHQSENSEDYDSVEIKSQATNRQYLAPNVARQNTEATNRQYLAPSSNEVTNRQYLAPYNNEATNNRQYLAPSVARQNTEVTNRQYLAPANNEATNNRQYLAPSVARQQNNIATNTQYLAPSISKAGQRNTEAIARQYSAPSFSTGAISRQYLAPTADGVGQRNNEATNRQYLAPSIARAEQDNGGYRY